MKRIKVVILITLSCTIYSCKQEKSGFFEKMPNRFYSDSLTIHKELFANLSIEHLKNNSIYVRTDNVDLIPFGGILKVENHTVFYKKTEKDTFLPYLDLSARKFDTLNFNYSDIRSDQVIAMGKMYDAISRDSLQYFQLVPTKRTAVSGSTYLKYVALKNGKGISYLTFSNYSNDYTIRLSKYPRVVWSSGQ